MRVLVTGASGFAGRAIVPALAAQGWNIRAAARDPTCVPRLPNVEAVALPDLAGGIDWTPLLSSCETVVHLAAIAHAGPGIAEERYDSINHLATASLARAAAQRACRLVFVSSIRAQSGPSSDETLTESTHARPTDTYGRSKLAAETAVRESGVTFTILRPVVMYGAGVKGNVASLARLSALPIPLPFGALTQRRSLLAVENLASAIRFVIETPATQNETYIVADPQPVTLPEMISIMRQARGHSPGLVSLPPQWIAGALRALGRGDLWERIGSGLVADAGKLRAAGWNPATDTRAGLTAFAQAASP
jgi:UDP-glucose 4-epimerase